MTGVDDHSRFCVSALVVRRATARPVCDALAAAMRAHGVPDQILTDNGKVFTGRFGPGTGEVLFDRICRENGIKHLLTAPRSPTTTGKVERFHKTLRREFLDGKVFVDLDEAQAASSTPGWTITTTSGPIKGSGWSSRGSGSVSPIPNRSTCRSPERACAFDDAQRGGGNGKVSFAGHAYQGRRVARRRNRRGLSRRRRSSACRIVGCSSRRTRNGTARPKIGRARPHPRRRARPRQATVGQAVTRKVDSSGRSASPAPPTGSGERTAAARCSSRSSATSSRSPPAARSSSPPHPPRPLTRTRRLRQPRRPTPPHQRRLTPHHAVTRATGAKPEHGYRDLTLPFSFLCGPGRYLTLWLR